MKDKLLASASNLEAMQGLIAKYYYSPNIRLQLDKPGRWSVSNGKRTLATYVEQRRGRCRFMQPTGGTK